MANCVCNVAAEFPILGSLGIISANLRTNREVIIADNNIVLAGPTYGDLSITGYAPLNGEVLKCPGKAGVSYNWDRRIECTSNSIIVHFIPRGGVKAHREGDIPSTISMTEIEPVYKTFSASAAGGPASTYLYLDHQDGHSFYYTGSPIQTSPSDGQKPKSLNIFGQEITVFVTGSLYLQSFSWEYAPPSIPTVSYSFLFAAA